MTLLPNLPDIGEYAPKIFPSLIMLFDGLKRAYEAAKDDEDSDDDSDEVRNFFFNLKGGFYSERASEFLISPNR